jgi:putative colanic acid biosynthesis acetyltransferase WcaF
MWSAIPAQKQDSMNSPAFHALDRFSNEDFNRGAPRWKEILWLLVSAFWFELPLPLPSIVRVFWLRLFGAKVGQSVVIRAKVHITMPWRLTLGDHVWIGEDSLFMTHGSLVIGSHTCISQRVFLCTASHDFRSRGFDLVTEPIEIGNQVWIAAQSFIGCGVRIGDGTIVSACSVVMKSLPGGVIARGNPLRVVGQRNE